jgi:hypothetical protein
MNEKVQTATNGGQAAARAEAPTLELIEMRGKIRVYRRVKTDPSCPGCMLPNLTIDDAVRMCSDAYKVPRELLYEIVTLIEQLVAGSRNGEYESVADGYTLYAWDYGEALVGDGCIVVRYVNAGGEVVEWAVAKL